MRTCKYINNILLFTPQNITPCYSCFSDKAPCYINFSAEKYEKINFEKIKKNIIEKINSKDIKGIPCDTCCQIIDCEEIPSKYTHIILSFWNNDSLKYNIFEVIQDLYKKNLLDTDNLIIEFQCGDIDNFRELNKLITLFEANGYKTINFLINNIKYRPYIDEILKQGKGTLSIICDFENKDRIDNSSYSKILRMYIGNAKDKNSIKVYYTLIKNCSDNIKDIKNFIETMFKTGINYIGLRLYYKDISNWINKTIPLNNCSKDYSKLILYFFKMAKKYSFYLDMDYKEQNIVLRKIFRTNKIQNKSFIKKIKKIFIK